MRKALPYIIIVVAAVVLTKTFDILTDHSDEQIDLLEKEKAELETKVNQYLNNWKESEKRERKLKEENEKTWNWLDSTESEIDSAITNLHNANIEEYLRISTGLSNSGHVKGRNHNLPIK